MAILPTSVRPEHCVVKDVSSAYNPEVIGWLVEVVLRTTARGIPNQSCPFRDSVAKLHKDIQQILEYFAKTLGSLVFPRPGASCSDAQSTSRPKQLKI